MNFKYCIWLTPHETDDEWYSYTNGFEPHVTIFSHLDEHEVSDKLKLIHNCDLTVQLVGELIYTALHGFNVLYHNINISEMLDWWPNNAHVSFYYKYADIAKEEMDALTKSV